MLPIRRVSCVATMACLGFALAGCGPSYPETIPVSGTVTLAGRPAAGAAVVFTPDEGKQATGTTDASGRFELSTFRLADGALPGRYRVTVAKTTVHPDDPDKVVFLIPRKYGNLDTSGLVCEVEQEMGPVQFDLQPEPEPASPNNAEAKGGSPDEEPSEPPEPGKAPPQPSNEE